MRQRANHVVGLVALDLIDRDVISLEDAFDVRHRHKDALGSLAAVGFIFLECLVAERLATGVEAHRHVRGSLALEQILQRIHKAKHRTGIEARRGDARIAEHRIECSENHRISIDEHQFLRFHKADGD